MKLLLIATAFSLVGSCASTKYSAKVQMLKDGIKITDSVTLMKYTNTIEASELQKLLFMYASSDFEGRATGEAGQKKAANFLKSYYKVRDISSPINDSIYYQYIPKSYFKREINATENVLAFIKGKEKPEEVLIISAHYDHLGIKDSLIYYGADDNGSGTVALLGIAQAFKMAEKDGLSPKRSVLFMHLTAEEIGLEGSRFYTENPLFLLDKTIANLNIDMIGRVDDNHKNNPHYLYLIGADRLSMELHLLSEKVNETFFHFALDYTYNDKNDKHKYYYRSDHFNFAKHNIPVIFYFNGVHKDYHKPTDTADKIDYKLLEIRTKFIFATAWQLANRETKLLLNENM